MDPACSSNDRRSSVSTDDRTGHQGRSRASPGQLSPSTSLEPNTGPPQLRQPNSFAPLDPLDEQQQASTPPETLDQLYEGVGSEADFSSFAGHELYRALRGDKGDDPLADELLWEGDFISTQRDFIQRKQEDELLQRLERRMGTTKARPMQQQVRLPSAGGARASDPISPSSPPSAAIAGFAAAAATGVMNLLGRVMPDGSKGASVDHPSRRASALSPATSTAASLARFGSGFSSAPGQLTPPSRLSQPGDGPTLSAAQDSPAAAAAETVTPRPFVERVTSSFRRRSSVNDRATAGGSAVGALGVLVAEDEAKRKAAEALPAVETPAAGQLTVTAGVAEAQPADAVVQVVKVVPKQPTAKELAEKERAAQEELQRMDTDARLQLEIDTYPWLRRKAVQICTHSDFELIVLLLIMGNCISLALYDPLQAESSQHNQTLQQVDLGLNVAFTVEMLLRIISMGGILQYLSHPWNAFDCLMVLAGYTTFIPMDANSAGLEGVKALRALRALRPLRTITRFAALRSIVVCFLEAVPLLVSVAAMLFFFLFIFAVAAAEIFGDAFHYACVDPGSGRMEKDTVVTEDEFGCGDRSCPAEFSQCKLFPYSLATQIAGFENLGMSMLSVFQAMTLTNWSFTMYRTMDYLSPAVVLYWLVMVVFGAYLVLNLFLAVLKTKFAKAKNLLDEKRRQRRAMKARRGSKRRNVLARATGWMKTRVASYVSSKAGNDTLTSHVAEVMAKKTASEFGGGDFGTPRSNMTEFTDFLAAQTGDGGIVSGHQRTDAAQAAGSVSFKPPVTRQLSRADSAGSGMSGYSACSGTSGYSGFTGMTGVSAASAAECLLSFEEFDESVRDLPWLKRTMLRAQYRVRWVVTSSWFNNIFLLLIILNTVALAIVYEGMSPEVEEALAIANFVFTAAFTLEMLSKMTGLGAWNYLRDPWNLFDALVVAFSLVELVTELMARTSSGGLSALRSVRSMRVLRSFRVLRVMKMFKYLESLKMIAAVLISSMASFASIVVLLVLFWMVFSIVGLHVFGGLTLDIPWPNHDSLINSMINSFHILNLENFQITMFSVIRATNYASSMFWLAWIIMGKFILLTLFLAVTLDAFERKYESDMKKGVRSQSMTSTMFSRLKKAGQRVKSMAASMAGSNKSSSGGNSGGGGGLVGAFSWRPGAGRSKAGATSGNDPGAASGLSRFQAGTQSSGSGVGDDASMGLLPGQPAADGSDGVAVVSAGAKGHSRGHRRSSVNGHSLSNDSSRCTTRQAPEGVGAGSHHSSAQHRHHHHHRRHSQEGGVQEDHSRRLTGERRRSSLDSRGPSPPPPVPGPVAEAAAAAVQDYYSSPSFGAGSMRLRQLRAGMQQQYSCAWQDLSSAVGFGWGIGSPNSTSLAAAAESYTHRRRSSSSSSGGGGSSAGSFTIKQEAAAAFAAAAAAEALRPCHVLPELLEDDFLNSAEFAASSRGGWSGAGAASISGHSGGDVDEADGFTWQEFLATVAAINYPSVHRQQQQALSRQHSSLQGEGSQGAGGFSGKASSSLGPIAEGLEGADALAIDQHPAPAGAPKSPRSAAPGERPSFDLSRISLSSPGRPDGQQLTPRHLAAEGAAGGAANQQQQQERLASAARSRSPVLQQLALEAVDKNLASLGFQPTAAQPETPTVGFSSSHSGSKAVQVPAGGHTTVTAGATAAGTAVANADMWAGLDGDTQEYARKHGGADSQAAASAGAASLPAAAAAAPAAAAQPEPPIPTPPEAKPAKDPARRVTLFTESMRERGECPAPPRSPRFADRPTDSRGQRRPAGALLSGSKLDEMLDSAAAAASQPTAGGTAGDGSRGGSRPDSAAGSSHGNATLQLLAEGSVQPAITAQAIKRRKAAAVSFTAEQLLTSVSSAPQGIAESAAGLSASTQPAAGADGVTAIGSEAQSQAFSSRRHSRAPSGDGSEAGFSDGGHSYVSGDSSRSGGWSTFSGMGRSRSRIYPDLAGVSLGLFPQGNRFRQAVYDLVTNKYFDYAMFFLIMLNCIAMAYEYPAMSRDDLDGQILFWSDLVFTIAFTIEAALKILAFGFKPYMSYFQNVIDILIVVSSLVMVVLDTMADLSVVKGLRVLRAIKPLRALTRSAGMQQIFKSLTLSLAAMGNVSMVVLLFFLIFGILGVQLFHGKFWSCNDTSVPDKAACVGSFVDGGVEVPRVWSNKPYNFDHLGMALVSLFVTVTLNGYLEIMDAAMAAPEDAGVQPQPRSNWSAFFFFAAFVLVVGYTLLNLYIGVVFYQFSRIRMQSQTGSAFLTDDQTEWVEMSKLVFRLKPPEKSPVPVNALRRRLYFFVQGKPFEYFIMAVIIGNSALMATSFYGQPAEMASVVEAINFAFTGIYVLEFVLKVIGLGWTNYWKVMWNKFDCCLLVTGIVDMALTLAIGPSMASFLKIQKIMRLLRLARVVKLMRSMKGLRSLFGTLMLSLPAFWNVGGLLALMFFIYAYIGMLLLGNVKRNGALNEHTNFERFWTAALTLFKVATNDNWTDVMIGCMIAPPDCDPSKDCGSWVVYPYFLSFVVLVTIIMLQLFTAVIIESFEAQEEQDRWKLRPDHLDKFVELWAEYDDGSGTIDPRDLEAMLLRLSPPLGLGKGASSTDVLRFVFDLDIPLLNGRVPFHRTAYELVRRCSGAEIPEGILKDQINKLVSRAFRNLKADEVLNFSVAVTVMRVQRKWRARMRAAKMKRKTEFRADRGVAPLYSDIVAARDSTMREALTRRQAGDLRWRPHPAYSQLWCAAEAVLAAEAAAAAAASYPRRRSSDSSSGPEAEAGPGGRWSSLAGLRASADGWMHRVTSGLTGGLQRIQRDTRGLFRRDTDRSGRSSIWGNFGSRATSKAPSVAGGASAAASAAASRAASGGISNATSMVVSEVDTVDSAM